MCLQVSDRVAMNVWKKNAVLDTPPTISVTAACCDTPCLGNARHIIVVTIAVKRVQICLVFPSMYELTPPGFAANLHSAVENIVNITQQM